MEDLNTTAAANVSSCSTTSTTTTSASASREIGRKSMSASPYLDHLMSTPVANTKRLRKDDERVNPFERHLLSRLHEPIWSPSILNYTSDTSMETPPARGWEIEHIAQINPIRIEESPSTHQNDTILDPQSEARAQEAISRFFSTNEPIAPSPIAPSKKVSESTDNTKGTNTDLSFPSILPKEFEQFLYSFSNSNNGSTNYSSNTANRNIFSCVDVEGEGSSNSNGSNSQGSGQHPPTPNAELNTSVTRRKLDFTFDMDCGEGDTRDADADDDNDILRQRHISTEDESDGENYPIASIILDFERSNGRTIPSPEDSSRAGLGGASITTLGGQLKNCAEATSISSSGYASIERISSSPTAMETSFSGAGGATNLKFVRSSCEEEYLSESEDGTCASSRLRLLLESPGATPIRMGN